jgi:hypothetical protein
LAETQGLISQIDLMTFDAQTKSHSDRQTVAW